VSAWTTRPGAPRADFLHVLMLPDFERADRIGEFWGNPKTRTFAELLIDCEENRTLRAVLVGMLRDTDRARPIVGIQLEQAIAVDAEEWGRCRSHGWVTAVADELSNEQEMVVVDRIRAVANPGSSRGVGS
jgi:hypothetical protein